MRGARVLLVVFAVSAILAWHVLGAVAVGAVLLAGLSYAARRSPKRRCYCCKGAKGHKSVLVPGAERPCTACGGSGSRVRWSTKVLAPSVAERLRQRGR